MKTFKSLFLFVALATGNFLLVQVSFAENQDTRLHKIAEYNNNMVGYARKLLAAGADVNAKSDETRQVARNEKGFSAPASKHTPLHYAAFRNTDKIAAVLLMHGADVNAKNSHGATPLHLAALASKKWGTDEVGAVLLQYGADVNAKNNKGATPMHTAAEASADKSFAALLLKHGANIEAKDPSGNTPLHFAAFWTSTNIVTVLLQHGAEHLQKNKKGFTPWDYAADKGQPTILNLFEKADE